MTDMKIKDIHEAITNGVSNMPGQEYWQSLDYGSPDWNDWIIDAQRRGINAVVRDLNQIDD